MNRLLSKLNYIQEQINLEKDRYEEAIRNDLQFEDVKVIYLKIKQLRKEADTVMRETNKSYKNRKRSLRQFLPTDM